MIRRLLLLALMMMPGLPGVSVAQSRLTLSDAVARARTENLDAQLARAAEREADARIVAARAAYLPTVDVSESWQRGNQPVFVFSSLLSQRRFTAANFAIETLNHPDAVDNFRVAVGVEQPIFAPGSLSGVRQARLGHEAAALERSRVEQDLTVRATGAFGRVLVAASSTLAAAAALEAAEADRTAAIDRRDLGRATDADVLQLDVHVARVREHVIRARAEERIARAELNQVMGEPLDTDFVLEPAPESVATSEIGLPDLEAEALANRPDVKLASLRQQLAEAAAESARAAFLPQVAVQAGWEANSVQWTSRTSSWVVGAVARINVFRGFADRARLTAAREQQALRSIERERTEMAARLDIRVAVERLEAARASEAAGRTAAEQARESRRIVRDRYEAGMTDIASLLRAAEAVQQTETREMAARVDVMLAQADLDRAIGRQ